MARNHVDTVAELAPHLRWQMASLLLMVAACGLSWWAMGYALRSLEDVWQDRVEALAEIHETTSPLYRVLPVLAEVGHPVAMDSAAIALAAARIESSKAWRTYLGTTLTEAEVSLINQTTGPVASMLAGTDSLVRTLKLGNHDRYVQQMNDVFLPRLSAVAQHTTQLVTLQQTVTRERVAEARRRYKLARGSLGASILLAVVLAAGAFRVVRAARQRQKSA